MKFIISGKQVQTQTIYFSELVLDDDSYKYPNLNLSSSLILCTAEKFINETQYQIFMFQIYPYLGA